MIGNEMVSNAPPDGYTLLWGASDMAMQPLLLKNAAAFDPLRSLSPIGMVVSTWGAYAVNPKVPARDLPEFIDYAKANPGKIRYGTNGTGGSLHLAVRLLEISTGIDLVHVPYRAITQVGVDVLSGEIEMASVALPNAAANRAGLRVLAQTGPNRHAMLSHVPTTTELGLPAASVVYWFGLFGPPGLPQSIAALIERELSTALNDPAMQEGFAARGADVSFLTTPEFKKRIDEDKKRWAALIPAMGLHPE
jgi:tripartite-type tricarboxylate transporter receptor subunit TctC